MQNYSVPFFLETNTLSATHLVAADSMIFLAGIRAIPDGASCPPVGSTRYGGVVDRPYLIVEDGNAVSGHVHTLEKTIARTFKLSEY